jgi:hypothetical protein
MTTIRTTAIAAVAAITIAAAMASPAQAMSKKGAFWAGVGTAAAFGAIGAAHGHGYYDDGYGYRGGRHYRRAARRCARRFGWHTWRWERCMDRRGY